MSDVIKFSVELVTPESAACFLDGKNGNNRRERKRTSIRYGRDMAAGQWVLTHQAIALGPDGEIIDGQHRLNGIIESGTSQLMCIARYMTEDAANAARRACDIGAKRTTAEVLSISGMMNKVSAKDEVAICLAMNLLIEPGYRSDPSTAEVAELYRAYGADARWSLAALPGRRHTTLHRASFAFARPASPCSVEGFATMVDGGEAPPNSAAMTWNRACQAGNLSTPGGSKERKLVMWRAVRIIQAHVTGEGDLSKLYTNETATAWFRNRRPAPPQFRNAAE